MKRFAFYCNQLRSRPDVGSPAVGGGSPAFGAAGGALPARRAAVRASSPCVCPCVRLLLGVRASLRAAGRRAERSGPVRGGYGHPPAARRAVGSGAGRGGRRGRGGLGLGPPAEPGRAGGRPPYSRRRRSGTGAGSGQRAGPPGRGAPAEPPGPSRWGCAAPARLGPTGPPGRGGAGRPGPLSPLSSAAARGRAGAGGRPWPPIVSLFTSKWFLLFPPYGRGQTPPVSLSPAKLRAAWLSLLPLALQGRGHGKQILVLGLDGAGKTSILHSLATNHVKRSVAPTEGFNAICVNTEESQMEFLESE